MTKLAKILEDKKMTYRDFQMTVYEKTGYYIGFDRISRIVNGKQPDIMLSTAKKIAESLDVKLEDII